MDIRNVDLDTIWKIRQQVMYPEEELSYVQLPEDQTGAHPGLYIDDRLVSIVSLFDYGQEIRFRKFATLVTEQGKGYGSQLLGYVMNYASANSKKVVWCHARAAASAFYVRSGMYTTGVSWREKGIEFIKMEKQFS